MSASVRATPGLRAAVPPTKQELLVFVVFVVGWCSCFHAPVKAEMDERASHDASAKEKEEERKKCHYMIKTPLKVKAKAVISSMARDLFFLLVDFLCVSQ